MNSHQLHTIEISTTLPLGASMIARPRYIQKSQHRTRRGYRGGVLEMFGTFGEGERSSDKKARNQFSILLATYTSTTPLSHTSRMFWA